jgi:hypothetical protein
MENDKHHRSDPSIRFLIFSASPDELLPEIITNKKLCLWQIGDSEFSLQIELSEYPSTEKRFSINPYYFLRIIGYN